MLYDETNARLLLGALMINPPLLKSDKYVLTKEDFEPMPFHMRLYQAIYSLAWHDALSIDAIDIYGKCDKAPEMKALFDTNNLIDFCQTVKQLSKVDNFEYYYEEVRKNTLLREYQSNGFDVSKFENEISKTTLDEIVNYYDGRISAIKKTYYRNKDITELKAGTNFQKIKDRFKEAPMFGASLWSKYLNTAARGWLDGQLVLAGCPSGSGKSTIGLANLVTVCCPRVWDDETEAFVENKCYQGHGGLYIEFEMKPDEEVTPRIVSSISGVECWRILNGKYEEGQEERVDEAIKILDEESNIHIVVMPNFTDDLIEAYVRDYVLNRDVKYVVFDYITDSMSASASIASKSSVSTRNDQVLSAISAKLKEVAVRYNIAVLTFTQVNASINSSEVLDAGCIAGSRAIQNVLDVGMILAPLRKEEQEICDMMMESSGLTPNRRPNRIMHLFKCRFGSEEQGIKIWVHLNLSTGHVSDAWVTDKYNKPYNMTSTTLVKKL